MTMTSAPWLKPLQIALCAGTLVLAVSASPASAQLTGDPDDEYYDSILNIDRRLLDQLLGGHTPSIEYRERSPLVIPAQPNLPPPGAQVAKGADWPVDPEVKAKKAARAEARLPPRRQYDAGKPISGTEENYRTGNTGTWDESKGAKRDPTLVEMFMSGKMFEGFKKEEYGTFAGEPPRTSLIAPPQGYLTPSPAAPYGVTPRSSAPEKKDPKP
jgi:hypothetical protein